MAIFTNRDRVREPANNNNGPYDPDSDSGDIQALIMISILSPSPLHAHLPRAAAAAFADSTGRRLFNWLMAEAERPVHHLTFLGERTRAPKLKVGQSTGMSDADADTNLLIGRPKTCPDPYLNRRWGAERPPV